MWEILLVPGASVDGIGVVLRIHHALADGIAAVAIAQQLFDPSGEVCTAQPRDRRPHREGRVAARCAERARAESAPVCAASE